MLGLKHGVNQLVDYDPEWPVAFDDERVLIQSAVGDAALGIEHYGSTAVIGLRAKPIIDILLGVAPLDDWIKCKRPRGRDRGERTHLVHIVEFGGESWCSNLAFRDALRADESLRALYVRTKEHAVTLAPEGRAKYNELKHSFFEHFKDRIARSSGRSAS